ncbi:MAG: DNA polymerase I [Alicyclobacillaceae bacterium]|nr:DNA polymerase I [Alicyclobacillaceae bacterium]
MSDEQQRLILIDGNSIAYRAFFALPPLSNAAGQQTNAVYGFTQMLLKLLEQEKPTHIAVAFDIGKKTFRHETFAEYKGTREKTPPELVEQFPMVRQLLDAFSIRYLEIPNFEADDIIGTLARQAEQAGMETLIVSGDKDLLQLVSGKVLTGLTKKGVTEMEVYNPQAVHDRYGLTPPQIVDLKGLMGDNSDNIPGVPGVGEKTAMKLLHEFHTVEGVYHHLEQVSGQKLREKLAAHQEQAFLSKRLATIYTEVPLEVGVTELAYHGYTRDAVVESFRGFGFRSLVDKIAGEMTAPVASHPTTSETSRWPTTAIVQVNSKEELKDVLDTLADPVGMSLHLSSSESYAADVLGLALATEHELYYVSFANELEVPDVNGLWRGLAEKVVFDVKTMAVLLDAHGIQLEHAGQYTDLMLASYLLNPSDGECTLEELVRRELSLDIPTPELQAENAVLWTVRKAYALRQMHHRFMEALAVQEMDDLFQKMELPLAFVLAQMEVCGFYVNAELLAQFGDELDTSIQRFTTEIYESAGVEFNINSPKQLGEVLFEKLGLPPEKKTKTGYSTAADVLERLAPAHEVVQKILDYRQLAKLKSTYVEGLLRMIRPQTGRVHTRFHQALTATGRLSSSEPNLQNIPIRMEEGRKLRRAFQSSYPDWMILSGDYSQIELRILAHLSGDEALIDAFRNGMDIHTRTAADVFEVAIEEVTPLMRRQAKAVNFGIVYGISDFGLSQNLNIPRREAARFIEGYFAKFPGVERYMRDTVAEAKKRGYVTTLLNRRRYLPDIHHKNYQVRSFAERTAMNTPIQGTAADIIKLAMVRMDDALKSSNLQARMLLQVHDELIFECPESELPALITLVRDKMENAVLLNVPLQVDLNSGRTWYDAK